MSVSPSDDPSHHEPQRLEADAAHDALASPLNTALQRMYGDGIHGPVVKNYARLLEQVVKGATGIIEDDSIYPVGEVDTLDQLQENESYRTLGFRSLGQLAVIRLNGGLGSSMGLSRAKSLLPIRGALSNRNSRAPSSSRKALPIRSELRQPRRHGKPGHLWISGTQSLSISHGDLQTNRSRHKGWAPRSR